MGLTSNSTGTHLLNDELEKIKKSIIFANRISLSQTKRNNKNIKGNTLLVYSE